MVLKAFNGWHRDRRESANGRVRPALLLCIAVMLAPAASADSYRLVVELQPGQSPAQLAEIARQVFRTEAHVTPMFSSVDETDDPLGLARIHVVIAESDVQFRSTWDAGYALAELGDFRHVEPDLQDVLIEPTSRGSCREGTEDDRTAKPAWALLSVNAQRAWELDPPDGGRSKGEGVRVCHIDTGWSNHTDLDASRLDLASDYDFLEDDDDAQDPLDYDGHLGHGTSTGSVIVSSGGVDESGNTLPPGKITGVAPNATLVPIRSIRSVIQFLDSDVARAVRRSVDAQCDVISMSLGGRAFFGLERALMDAVRNEVIPIAAAGNCVGFVVAPAMYDATIAVAASNIDDEPWRGSSRGRAVDIAAPGESVHVAWKTSPDDPDSETQQSDGTSYATAMTAGAAALWIAYHGEQAIRDAYGAGTRKDLFLRYLQQTSRQPVDWDAERFGAGIIDVEALLAQPLEPDNGTLRRATSSLPHIEVLSRLTGREQDALRPLLGELFGENDLADALERFGPELAYVAARKPEAMKRALDRIAQRQSDSAIARRSARGAMAQLGSKSLFDYIFDNDEPPSAPPETTIDDPEPVQRVLLEVDRMRGTRPVRFSQEIRGTTVSLAQIYGAAGIDLRIVEDQADIPRQRSLRLADLHALLTANRSLTPADGEQHMYMMVVTEDNRMPDTLGIMFDFGENDANDVPRESFAVFESAHRDLPGGVARELLLTTAHELAHAFNLHHTDWDGASFTRRATVESYSLADTVRWRLSPSSINHLLAHPQRLVQPGSDNLPFGMIIQEHADDHKASPRESYSIVPSDTSALRRQPDTGISAAIRTRLAPSRDVSQTSPLELRIKTAKSTYVAGEAIALTVAIVNSGTETRDVVPLLSTEYGFLETLIRGPGDDEFRPYRPPVIREARMARLSRALAPGELLIDDARVFFGSGGWTFAAPGGYEIQASFPADTEFSGDVIRSETLRITVEPAQSAVAASAEQLLYGRGGAGFGSEQGIYLYMGGGDHLEFGSTQLRQLVREFPAAEQADSARLALASEALQPTVDSQRGVRPPQRTDEARSYLKELRQPEYAPGVHLQQLRRQVLRQLEAEGRSDDAAIFERELADPSTTSRDLELIDRTLTERDFD
ncbi:MAG: S8/S53 family peptidase [Gammaproteobacteria bacterium]|nr:S8/S53 family peptidase [Gammaproteobacteria bacterium]